MGNTSLMAAERTLPDRVREIVERKNLAPAVVSREMGRNATYVRDIIIGKVRSPKAEHLPKLAAALGVTVDELLSDTAPSADVPPFRSEAAPWSPPEDVAQAIRALCPSTTEPFVLKVRVSSPNFGIYAGDLIAIDTAREARQGEIVAVHVNTESNGNDRTRIRRYLPPYLVSSEEGPSVEPELADGQVNTIMGPVVAVIRTKGG